MWSATVASPRRKAAADRTRGAWPQSVRALAEKTSIVVCDVDGAKRLFTAKKVDGRALVRTQACKASQIDIQGLPASFACCFLLTVARAQHPPPSQQQCNNNTTGCDNAAHLFRRRMFTKSPVTPLMLLSFSMSAIQERRPCRTYGSDAGTGW